jgi:L-galactono-1,4-lactone dehydrogenase
VQAGATVQEVVEALRPYGLTLQNFASVREQQIGGFMQVSAHGTGSALPPVDEQVVSCRVVSPGSGGAVEMVKGKDAAFDWVKVGLGAMGVVTEVTLQCVNAHKLIEKTFVATRDEVKRKHKKCVECPSSHLHSPSTIKHAASKALI